MVVKNLTIETAKRKKKKETKAWDSIKSLWGNLAITNTCVIRFPEGGEKGSDNYFQE